MAVDYTEVANFTAPLGWNYRISAFVYIRMDIIGLELEQSHVASQAGPKGYFDAPLSRDFAIRLRDALTVALDRTDPEKTGRDRVTGGVG